MRTLARILVSLVMVCTSGAQAQGAPLRVELQADQVRLRDIAVGIAEGDALGDRIVARIAPGQNELLLERSSIARILRNQAPAMELTPRWSGAIVLVASQSPSVNLPECSALAVPVSAGAYVQADMLVATGCLEGEHAARSLTYDRTARSLRATTDLNAGTYLGSIHAGSDAIVPAGSELILRSGSGPVLVDRQVRTVQPARAGDQVFVQAADGTVLVGRLNGVSQ